jgi:hypothetical protein
MGKTAAGRIARRDFVKKAGLGAVMGAGCLRAGLKEALAAAQVAGKPLLTEGNLNAFIATKTEHEAEFRQSVRDAEADLKGLVRTHFHLTAEQEQALESLTQEQTNKIIALLNEAAEKHAKVEVRFITDAHSMSFLRQSPTLSFAQNPPPPHGGHGGKSGKTTVSDISGSASASAMGVTVTVSVHCHKETTTK